MEIRNIAIIAHVDHGKTTLVDALLKIGNAFDSHESIEERVMDSNDQEKERGITIYSKNASIEYAGTKINIVDTPGHADFGSEVERVLNTVDATLLLVDAYEGPMPQTRFVLRKSLQLDKKILVVINKIDKPSARIDFVLDKLFDLFVELGANDTQLDFPSIFTIARDGIAVAHMDDPHENLEPLMEFILTHVPRANNNQEGVFAMQPATLSYDNFLGRIAVGRVYEGSIASNKEVMILTPDGTSRKGKISKLFTFKGLKRVAVDRVEAGDIVAIAGIENIFVGETISGIVDGKTAEPLPAIQVDPPSLAMYFMVNDSPFAGREGKFLTSRHIKERLEKELNTNVGLEVEFGNSSEKFKVLGRGEMHLAVLIETLRREGFELQVSQPEVVFQEKDGEVHEPIEKLSISVPEAFSGKVIELITQRKGVFEVASVENGLAQLTFTIPTRGFIGIRSNFTILTKGEGTMYAAFSHLAPYVGKIEKRKVGSLISMESGMATGYSLFSLQERGPLFIGHGVQVYEGMIIGEHNLGTDLNVNPIKGKKLTNVRAASSDEAIILTPPLQFTLEKALEYIKDDEYVEVTPTSVRLRKKWLNEHDRRRNAKHKT